MAKTKHLTYQTHALHDQVRDGLHEFQDEVEVLKNRLAAAAHEQVSVFWLAQLALAGRPAGQPAVRSPPPQLAAAQLAGRSLASLSAGCSHKSCSAFCKFSAICIARRRAAPAPAPALSVLKKKL